MKCSRAAVHRTSHCLPEIRFEDQRLTSFAGLIVFQSLFNRLRLKGQLTGCFRHLKVSPIFGHGLTVLLLIVHLLLGSGGFRICVTTRMIPWCVACWGWSGCRM